MVWATLTKQWGYSSVIRRRNPLKYLRSLQLAGAKIGAHGSPVGKGSENPSPILEKDVLDREGG